MEQLITATTNITLVEGKDVVVYTLNGEFVQQYQDIITSGLVKVDGISILKMNDKMELAKDDRNGFRILATYPPNMYQDLHKQLATTVGLKYILQRTISSNCVQYLYIYEYQSIHI